MPEPPRPIIDFGQHRLLKDKAGRGGLGGWRNLVTSRRLASEWGIGLIAVGSILGFSLLREQYREMTAEKPELPARDAITPGVIDSLEDPDLVYMVSDYAYAYWYLDRQVGSTWPENLRRQPAHFRAILGIAEVDGEVNNGGFSQFFFNSSGQLAYEARDGCLLLGLDSHTAIINEAIDLEKSLGTPYSRFPDSATYRQDTIMDSDNVATFDDLDTRWFDAPVDPYLRCAEYIRANKQMFLAPAIP